MLGHGGGGSGGGGAAGGESATAAASGLGGVGTEIDGMLAGAGYRVRSSDIRHVAQRLERLESAMISDADSSVDDPLPVHYNPTDLAAWVDSMLYELDQADLSPPPPLPGAWEQQVSCQIPPQQMPIPLQNQTAAAEEDSGIQLVHLLMSCAEAIQRGDSALAGGLFKGTRSVLARMNTDFGIGKVARYFADALGRRIYSIRPPPASSPAEEDDDEIVYRHFYEAAPYIKFAHFTANQAILDAFHGFDRVHVVDLALMDGLQWPALIQALALRPGGPPSLRLTGIGPPPPLSGKDPLREVGLRLADLARSVGVKFAFRGVAARRADDVRPWMLQAVDPGEAVAVNSVMQLHRLLGDRGSPVRPPVESVLGWIRELRPRIVTVVEQEADHNREFFVDRFTEALFFYSTVFDSLEASGGDRPLPCSGKAVAEVYLQRQICDIVCFDGEERRERHEPMQRWMARLGTVGFRQVHLGSDAFRQSSVLLAMSSGEGYCVEEVDGCLALGWHGRRLVSASAWRADDEEEREMMIPERSFVFNGAGGGSPAAAARRKNSSSSSSSGSSSVMTTREDTWTTTVQNHRTPPPPKFVKYCS